jgi:hypothetical protein
MHVYTAGLGYSYDGTGLTVPEYLVREAFSKQNLIKKNNGVFHLGSFNFLFINAPILHWTLRIFFSHQHKT